MPGFSAHGIALIGIIFLVLFSIAGLGGTIAFLLLSLKKKKKVFIVLCPVAFVVFISMTALAILSINNLPEDEDKHRPAPSEIYYYREDLNLLHY